MKIDTKIFRKTLVILIIILFVGTSITPAISGIENRDKTSVDQIVKPEIKSNENIIKTDVLIQDSDISGIKINNIVNVDELTIEEIISDSIIYHKVSIPGYFYTSEVGKPQVPMKNTMIAIPDGVNITVNVLHSNYTTLGGYNIYPVPEQVVKEDSNGLEYVDEEFFINETFYSTNSCYPESLVKLDGISNIRDQRVAQVSFQPVQYNSVTGELRVYSFLQVKLVYSGPVDSENVCKNVGPYASIFSKNVKNYDDSKIISSSQTDGQGRTQGVVSYPSDLSDHGNSADYLIITSDYFYNPAKQDFENGTLDNRLNELAHWRAEYNGFDVAVVSVNDSFIGGNVDINIKSFIKHVYYNWSAPHMDDNHVGYILLVGDTPYVTFHITTVGGGAVYDGGYACIDVGDIIPDIMIGRFSVDDYDELDVIADKTIQYEQNPVPGDWRKKILNARGSFSQFPWYQDTKRFLELGGWNVFEVFKLEGGDYLDHLYAIVNNIKNGRGIVTYCGHGTRDKWEIFHKNSVSMLNNGYKLPIIYSLACSTGRFQGTPDCLGEAFLNTPDEGAVAFWGASAPALTTHFAYADFLFKSIFENFEYILGKIIIEGSIQFGPNEVFNLLGDPALDLSGSLAHPEKPDLAISHLNISIDTWELMFPFENFNCTIHATIHNIGGGVAENVDVQFRVVDQDYNELYIIDNYTVTIPPSGQITLSQQHDLSLEYIDKYLVVQIDYDNLINESYELNNQAGIPIDNDVIYVDDDAASGWYDNTHFMSIQEAVDIADEGQTIIVWDGFYQENIIIDKTISLIGRDKEDTVIDGGGNDNVIKIINADNVTVRGFRIQNGESSYYGGGIRIYTSDYVNITGNTIINNSWSGIRLEWGSSHNTITDNIIKNNTEYGINFVSIHDSIISENTIENNNFGMHILGSSANNIITKNSILNNYYYGIRISDSDNNNIYYNSFINNNHCNNQAYETGRVNSRDNGYPDGGNYWDDFDEPSEGAFDKFQGENQDLEGFDGIIDLGLPDGGLNPYFISGGGGGMDQYPLTHPFFLYVSAGGPYFGFIGDDVEFVGFANNGIQPYVWLWDFGDGNTSELQNPTHRYSIASNYTVTLTVTDSANPPNVAIDTTTAEITIPELVADANGPYEGYVDEEIEFHGSASGGIPPYSWLWDFGDGNMSEYQNSSNIFNAADTYTVTLTVTDSANPPNLATDVTTATITDIIPPTITITKPEKAIYINNRKIMPFFVTIIIGNIDIEVDASDDNEVDRVEFYIDNEYVGNDTMAPYSWNWDEQTPLRFRHTIIVIAYDSAGNSKSDEIIVWKFNSIQQYLKNKMIVENQMRISQNKMEETLDEDGFSSSNIESLPPSQDVIIQDICKNDDVLPPRIDENLKLPSINNEVDFELISTFLDNKEDIVEDLKEQEIDEDLVKNYRTRLPWRK